MLLRWIISIFVVFVCIAMLLAPVLIDAHHWWPRKRKKTDSQSPHHRLGTEPFTRNRIASSQKLEARS